MAESIVATKSYNFALRIIKLYKHLTQEQREFVLAKQVLRSGTSIGANVEEALGGQSKADFRHKLSIALKEARETSYWLRLLKDSDYVKPDAFKSIHSECDELIKILRSIILTSQQKEKNS
ncbi:four helix bundle protein [Pontibacter cellulosilyticus]|uniref:Four helix bundle protein n=1 Tax=Pontibacter cellulosilyticus TaxID=1720253 RepID=A0A923N924_9BACT|nr:four helix bundle protein [Pontibacter cellulosilyticus]MBC5993959.1 four helix bundle protein [Pontibacter cellulosilyticus]